MLLNYSDSLQKKFLLFTTGSDRVPVGGMQEMTFKITKLKVCPVLMFLNPGRNIFRCRGTKCQRPDNPGRFMDTFRI